MKTELKTCMGGKPFPFMKYKWFFILISVAFMVMSLNEVMFKGINFGVDFKGGVKILYQFPTDTTADQIRSAVEGFGVGDIEVIKFGTNPKMAEYMVRAKYMEGKNIADIINAKMMDTFGKDKLKVMSVEEVGPKVGHDLQKKGLLSLVLTCVLILIYTGFRFDFLFAPGAIVALVHDVLISVGVFAFFGKEFNLPILAALLTILGYSINDTIVIYDRIRENIQRLPKNTPTEIVIDISMTETFRRTIVTSLTVFFVVAVLYFFGGSVLQDFAFCLIVGVIFGCYSSIFIASPFYLYLQKAFPKKGINVAQPAKVTA